MYTYFIYDKKTRLLKIGKSKNPFNRLTVLSTSNGNLMLIYFSDLITEKDAHIFFKENRIFGEWFNIRPLQLFDYIGQKVGLLASIQDTGSAIKGPFRGDLYFGSGAVAGLRAGVMKHKAEWRLLVPKNTYFSAEPSGDR